MPLGREPNPMWGNGAVALGLLERGSDYNCSVTSVRLPVPP